MKVALAGLFISGWNRRRDEVRWRGKRGRLAYERWRHSGEVAKEYVIKDVELRDPTTLILIDEADRLRMASLEQVRAVFDAREIGVILIGMLEKRLARYPRFYSRIGFVHEFRPLSATQIRQLLEQHWTPPV